MKKITILLLLTGIIGLNAQVLRFNDKDEQTEQINRLEKEIESLKNEVEQIKAKTSLLDFSISGSTKVTWGINFSDNPFGFLGNSGSAKAPIHGFDFENNLELGLNLNNSFITKGNNNYDFSEILFKFKMETIRSIPYDYAPNSGDYYEVDAFDQDGNPVKIYFPKNDSSGNDLVAGNFRFILEQARLSNVLGTGFFINYADVTNVNKYYGVSLMVDVMEFNHNYFSHNFRGNGNLYYSFDSGTYSPSAVISEAVNFWTDSELGKNQKPHGVSFGVDKQITNQFHFYIEGGLASKDGFDPKVNTDNHIDYGFFITTEPLFKTEQFNFNPKIHFGIAFQTDTTEDRAFDWSSINLALSVPVKLFISDIDRASVEFNLNYKRQNALNDNAFMFSVLPELNILKNAFNIQIPIQYWYKDGKGGFSKVENIEGSSFEQLHEEHIFSSAIKLGFNSNNLFSDSFTYKVSNSSYFTTLHSNYTEFFFHNILTNQLHFLNLPFLGTYVTMDSFILYTDIGFGLAKNARLEQLVKLDPAKNVVTRIPSGERADHLNVLFGEFGFMMNFTPHVTVGFSMASPKVNLDVRDTIGNQNTYATFKIWSELKL